MTSIIEHPNLWRGIRPRKGGQAGFSLVELMVALAIIAIALFAMMSMIVHTQRAKEAQRELATAKQAVVQKLEQIRVQPWDVIRNPASDIYLPFSVVGLQNRDQADHLGKGTSFVDAGNVDGLTGSGLVDVKVEVEWRGISGLSRYSLRHMFTR